MSYNTSIYPYDAIVRFTDTIGGVRYQGSGVLISPDEVLTASHMVYQQELGTATDIVVTPGYSNGNSPYGSVAGTYFHYFPINDANGLITNQQSQFDYAVIHLATPYAGLGHMGLQSNFAGGLVTITGYPGSAGGAQISSSQFDYRDPYYTLLDGAPLGPGSSGGPVWMDGGNGPLVVGVVSSGGNGKGYSSLITTHAFNQITAWIAQDDALNPTPAPSHRIATFNSTRASYAISYVGNGDVNVVDGNTATRVNAEALQFPDQLYFIEDGNGANIARLYSAGLGRTPDAGGLFGWENYYNGNVSPALKAQGVYVSLAETSGGFNGGMSIADGVIYSAEFSAKYGALSDQAFITQLYGNVLDRAPDPTGLNGWLNYMTPGNASGTTFSRGMVLVGFAESSENVAKTSAWMTDLSR